MGSESIHKFGTREVLDIWFRPVWPDIRLFILSSSGSGYFTASMTAIERECHKIWLAAKQAYIVHYGVQQHKSNY